jgi:preprotein translocase subunit SecG
MYVILLAIHFLIAIMLIGLILIQHGKGAQTGASFGSGASQTVFGSQGSGGFLSRTTTILAALFFLLNLFLVFYLNKSSHREVPYTGAMMQPKEASGEDKGSISKGATDSKQPANPPVHTDVPEVDDKHN